MHRYVQFTLTGLTATALVIACRESTTPGEATRAAGVGLSNTAASGFAPTLVARGNAGAFHIQAKANGYDVEIKASDNTDIAVANVVVAPRGGNSGWHSHPGPVLVVVTRGTITFYRAGGHGDDASGDDANGDAENADDHSGKAPKCSRTVYPTGAAFIELPGHKMLARNEGSIEATVTATYFAPAGAALSISETAPGGNCPN